MNEPINKLNGADEEELSDLLSGGNLSNNNADKPYDANAAAAYNAVPGDESEPRQSEPERVPEILIVFSGDKKGDKSDCLKCNHLVSHAKKVYNCHYDDGNESCPAPFYRIMVGVNLDKASDAMAQALEDGDIQKIQKITDRLKDKDPIIIEEVMARAKAKWAQV